MSERTHFVIVDPPTRAGDPIVSLDMLSRAFVCIGWLVVAGGVVMAIAMGSQEQPVVGVVTGVLIALGGGSWLFYGYAGRVLCRIAACTELIAKRDLTRD